MACKKCGGTGSYMYDHNHGKFCEDCCDHPDAHHYIQSEGYPSPGQLTCGRCGTSLTPTSKGEG